MTATSSDTADPDKDDIVFGGAGVSLFLLENGLVVGHVNDTGGGVPGVAGATGDIALIIEIDADTGVLAVAQYLAILHADDTSVDESASFTGTAIKVVVTVTNKDGSVIANPRSNTPAGDLYPGRPDRPCGLGGRKHPVGQSDVDLEIRDADGAPVDLEGTQPGFAEYEVQDDIPKIGLIPNGLGDFISATNADETNTTSPISLIGDTGTDENNTSNQSNSGTMTRTSLMSLPRTSDSCPGCRTGWIRTRPTMPTTSSTTAARPRSTARYW